MMILLKYLKEWYKILIILLTPLIFLPIPLILQTDAWRCCYIVILLLVYWISECIPVPVTSLLPLILFPLSGILTASEVASNYFKDTATFFFGSVSLAYAIQQVNLHRRIALFVLTFVGSSPKWTMAGLMSTTFFLSMWMNNAACTSIMLPIALAIANEYQLEEDRQSIENECSSPNHSRSNSDREKEKKPSNDVINLRKGLILCVAYGSVYGGLATIVGSAATIFLKGYIDEHYAQTDFQVTFVNYFLYAFPTGILMLGSSWLWLQVRYNSKDLIKCKCRQNEQSEKHLKETLKKQYNDLGPLKWNEMIVGLIFVFAVLLWITRDLAGGGYGWNRLFPSNSVSNGTVALFSAILTMIFPNQKPSRKNWKYTPILSWTDLSRNYPWGTLTLVGAGLSIAEAFQVSKLSNTFADALKFVDHSPDFVVLITIIILSEICTQFINNLSIASILFPVISTLANRSAIHPGRLLLPSILSLSLAFLLPISSQPNALVFASGHIQTIDFFTTGIVMNLIGGLIILFASTTWITPIFHLDRSFISMNSTLNNSSSFP